MMRDPSAQYCFNIFTFAKTTVIVQKYIELNGAFELTLNIGTYDYTLGLMDFLTNVVFL